jgi:TolA-binding protein
MMRRLLPGLLALALGVGAALLVACGSSTSGGVPAGDGSVIKGQLDDVRQRVADGQCDGLSDQLRQVDSAIDGLPRSVDARLVKALSDGSTRLRSKAVNDCNDNRASTQTQTTPPATTTAPPATTTTPPETTTTPPETTTSPPETTTTPPPTATFETPPPPEPAPVPPPPPAVNPGGGTPPEIP